MNGYKYDEIKKRYTVEIIGYLGGGGYQPDILHSSFDTKEKALAYIEDRKEHYKDWLNVPSLTLIDNKEILEKEIDKLKTILASISN